MKKAVSFFMASVFLFLLWGCSNGFYELDNNDVEKIVVWSIENGEHEEKDVNENARNALIDLYNNAEYAGDDDGVGTTPQMGINIYTDGKVISVNLFQGDTFEVYNGNKRFYIKSPIMKELLARLV